MNLMVETKELSKYYYMGENKIKAVDKVNLKIFKNEFVSIVGKSASGKSTLMNLLGGLDIPNSGSVIIDGVDISRLNEKSTTIFRRNNVGFVFQAYNLIPALNVWENIVLPIGLNNELIDTDYINEICMELGIYNNLKSFPNKLSGGQQQRVAIARALATRPAIILADEPTGNLDSETSAEVMFLLKKTIKKYQQTLVMITHDNDIANSADRIFMMKDGRISEL